MPGVLVAGRRSLVAATVAYYVTDSFVSGAGTDMVIWFVVGVPFGLVLGVVGAAIRMPGSVGLLAALVVPVGAAVKTVVLSPRPHRTLTPAIVLAEVIVRTAAVLGACCAVYRFRTVKQAARSVRCVQSG